MSLHRLTPPMLQAHLSRAPAPLLLDVRRSEAFKRNPAGIAGAVPVFLDEAGRHCEPDSPQARFALDPGPPIVGYIGSQERRALPFIGPSINAAACHEHGHHPGD